MGIANKILVTGATGYLGKYIVDELLKRRYKVFCLVLPNAPLLYLEGKKVTILRGDITNQKSCYQFTKGMDAIIHLAAAVRIKEPEVNWAINTEGTMNLVVACKKNKVKRFIHMSTITVTRKDKGPYGKSKTVAEWFFPTSNLNYTIFRPTIPLGKEGKGISNIIQFLELLPWFVPLIGDAHYTRQPIYVYDLAKVVVESINNKKTYKKTYPLAGDDCVSFYDLVNMIAEELEIHKPYVQIPESVCKFGAKFLESVMPNPPITSENVRSLTQDEVCDISELKRDTGFRPTPLKIAVSNVLDEKAVIAMGDYLDGTSK